VYNFIVCGHSLQYVAELEPEVPDEPLEPEVPDEPL
jgi:hypothetical protein